MDSFALGNVAVAARGYRRRGKSFVSAIVKGTFALVLDRSMAPLDAEPIVRDERRNSKSPVASLSRASDLALVLARPEVLVVGDACAPGGREVARLSVGLQVVRGDRTLLAKTLECIGERRGRRDSPPPEPRTFSRMPIVYERAYGGLAHRANPVGVGMEEHSDGTVTWPSVIVLPGGISAVQVADPSLVAAGFGPIAPIWPLRKQMRGSATQRDADFSEVFDWPADLDETYFQAAQVDQQVADLLPGDWIVVTGMHPHHEKIRSSLPEVMAYALAQGASGRRYPFALRIDTVHVDVNAQRAEIVWRGTSLVDDRDLAGVRVAGMLGEPGQTPSFADLSTLTSTASEPPPATVPLDALVTTQVIETDGGKPLEHKGSGTLVMEPDKPAKRATLELDGDARPASLPFRDRAKAMQASAAPVAPPGSPWAEGGGSTARPVSSDLTTTLVTEVESLRPDASSPSVADGGTPAPDPTPVVEPPPARAAPAERAPEAKPVEMNKVVWRKDVEPPPEKPAAPPIPRATVQGEIYKKRRR